MGTGAANPEGGDDLAQRSSEVSYRPHIYIARATRARRILRPRREMGPPTGPYPDPNKAGCTTGPGRAGGEQALRTRQARQGRTYRSTKANRLATGPVPDKWSSTSARTAAARTMSEIASVQEGKNRLVTTGLGAARRRKACETQAYRIPLPRGPPGV
jgi:hypothetical protein